jgi:hypothetical protein
LKDKIFFVPTKMDQQGPEKGSDLIPKEEPSADLERRGQDLLKQIGQIRFQIRFQMADQDHLSSQEDAQAAMTRQLKILVDLHKNLACDFRSRIKHYQLKKSFVEHEISALRKSC